MKIRIELKAIAIVMSITLGLNCTKNTCPEVLDGTTSALTVQQVPQAVKDSFALQYPNKVVNWTSEDTDFEANFVVNYIKHSVVYSPTAVRKIEESDASFTVLPQAVQDGAYKDFEEENIVGAAILHDFVANVMKFEVAIYESSSEKWDLIFDEKGNLLAQNRVCN
jgi:hypothetical protein